MSAAGSRAELVKGRCMTRSNTLARGRAETCEEPGASGEPETGAWQATPRRDEQSQTSLPAACARGDHPWRTIIYYYFSQKPSLWRSTALSAVVVWRTGSNGRPGPVHLFYARAVGSKLFRSLCYPGVWSASERKECEKDQHSPALFTVRTTSPYHCEISSPAPPFLSCETVTVTLSP